MNALAAPGSAVHARWELTGPAACADEALQRENITRLCTSMLWLRSWWDSHQAAVRAIDSKAAAEIHDHFIDGAIFARGTARGMKLELDEQRIRNYRWGNSAQSLRLVVAVPAAAAGRTA
jgi:hypothetical protein